MSEVSGRELDKQIAEALGYYVENINENPQFPCFMLHAPDGHWVNLTRFDRGDSEQQAWEGVPHYNTDSNLALELIDQWFTLEASAPEHWKALFVGYEPVYAETPALAICRAWLARKAVQS